MLSLSRAALVRAVAMLSMSFPSENLTKTWCTFPFMAQSYSMRRERVLSRRGHLSERGAYCAIPTHCTLECTQRITRVAGAPRCAHAPRVARVFPFATLRVHVPRPAAQPYNALVALLAPLLETLLPKALHCNACGAGPIRSRCSASSERKTRRVLRKSPPLATFRLDETLRGIPIPLTLRFRPSFDVHSLGRYSERKQSKVAAARRLATRARLRAFDTSRCITPCPSRSRTLARGRRPTAATHARTLAVCTHRPCAARMRYRLRAYPIFATAGLDEVDVLDLRRNVDAHVAPSRLRDLEASRLLLANHESDQLLLVALAGCVINTFVLDPWIVLLCTECGSFLDYISVSGLYRSRGELEQLARSRTPRVAFAPYALSTPRAVARRCCTFALKFFASAIVAVARAFSVAALDNSDRILVGARSKAMGTDAARDVWLRTYRKWNLLPWVPFSRCRSPQLLDAPPGSRSIRALGEGDSNKRAITPYGIRPHSCADAALHGFRVLPALSLFRCVGFRDLNLDFRLCDTSAFRLGKVPPDVLDPTGASCFASRSFGLGGA
ncbi:hypothetical protein B0H15DRAFT_951280 [Mycena belliarum]|uniref:Uncharacterized protein n=1 Tax=Mycena belliarum TaxID=1033014 RepID=A0AAD6XST4_9AGAR|nr:hypothetical protein B0H15DRAFT_951280 [Mycena belliae]